MFMALYYANIWSAQDFPFLSQELFNITGANATFQQAYNQSLILNSENMIDDSLVQLYGAPWLTSSKDNRFFDICALQTELLLLSCTLFTPDISLDSTDYFVCFSDNLG
jgi:hypothetical protein